jgi:hypothetical protein
MDSVLRPRDIQARIRSGESPETVAVAAQTSVDRIMGFATPVLAERAYVAQQAQKASVRRRAGEGQIGHLGDAVTARLDSCDVDPEAVEWDSWRREDGRWTLVADYVAGGEPKRAQFIYDVAGRYVVADDDESRWLVGERSAATPTSQQRMAASPASPASSADDAQLPLGDDAIALVTGHQPPAPQAPPPLAPPAAPDAAPAADEPVRQAGQSGQPARSVGADWISTQASDRPAPVARKPVPAVEPQPSEALFDATEVAPAPPPAGSPSRPDDVAEVEPADVEQGDAEPAEPRKKSSRGRGRASVPSWDEIMFGSNQGD